MSQPLGLGNVCQPQSESVPSGVVFSNASGNVCRPVASTVKQNSPLPTESGLAASKFVSTTSCRVTSAWRSIGAAVSVKFRASRHSPRRVCMMMRFKMPEGVHGNKRKCGKAELQPMKVLGDMVILILLPMNNSSGLWVNLNAETGVINSHVAAQERHIAER